MLDFFRKKTKMIMIVVAVVFAFSMFYGIRMTNWQGEGGNSKEIGKVNGQAIDPLRYREMVNRIAGQLGGQVNPRTLPFIENMALGQTIDFMLVLGEAQKRVKVSRQELSMAVEGIMKQQKIASKQQLTDALKRVGLTYGDFERLIKQEMLVQKMATKIRQETKVVPDDLREVRASHILVSDEAAAKMIMGRLKSGGNFSALAKQYSLDSGSGAKGGDLGYFTTGAMVEPFEKAAFQLKDNELSGIIKSQYGYHIILVTDSRLRKFPAGTKDVEKAALAEKQENAFRVWFMGLKQKAKVEITNPELKAIDLQSKGRIWEAIEQYKKAIKQTPNNPYLDIFLADAYAAAGKKELAVSEYEAAISKAGGNIELYVILAQAYEKWGDKELALQQYRRASLIAGDNKEAHEVLLKVFQKLGSSQDVQNEKAELARIAKKAKFEKELGK